MSFPVLGDAIEPSLNLHDHLISNPAATFLMRVGFDVMPQASRSARPCTLPNADLSPVHHSEIQSQDLLIVDRSLNADYGQVVVATVEGELVVMRLSLTSPACEIWGVVTAFIRSL